VEEAYLEVLSLGDELQVRVSGFRCCVIAVSGTRVSVFLSKIRLRERDFQPLF
jgi:hypothetical protein